MGKTKNFLIFCAASEECVEPSLQHLSTPNFLIIRSPLFISHFRADLCGRVRPYMQFLHSTARFNLIFLLLSWTLLTTVVASPRRLYGIVQIKLGVLGDDGSRRRLIRPQSVVNYLSSHWRTRWMSTFAERHQTIYSVAATTSSPTWIFPRRWTLVIF